MPRLTSSQFMQALPDVVRPQVLQRWRKFKTAGRPWLVQLYYADPLLHYEVSNLGERRGLLEIGLHFESRNSSINTALLEGSYKAINESDENVLSYVRVYKDHGVVVALNMTNASQKISVGSKGNGFASVKSVLATGTSANTGDEVSLEPYGVFIGELSK